MTNATTTAITATASVCAAIVTALLMVGTLLGGNRKEKVSRWFFVMLSFGVLGGCCEALVAVLTNIPGHRVATLIWVADFVSYLCGSGMLAAFALYLYEYLCTKGALSPGPFHLAVAFGGLNILLTAFAQFGQLYARLDEHNNYHRQDAYWISLVLPCLSLLVLQASILRHIKWLKPREWVSLLVYTLFPPVCYLAEYLYAGVWVTYFGCAVAMFFIYVNIQIERKQRMDEQELRLKNQQMAVRISQVQPHFVFNTLSSIRLLVETDPRQAAVVVDSFADHLRANLDTPDMPDMIRFNKELAHVHAYLTVEKQRFKDELQVEYDIGPRFFPIPPLTLQPIVNNAVLHGLTVGKGGSRLIIRTEETPDAIVVSVIDDGTGFDPSAPPRDGKNHLGLESVRARLELLCGGRLLIESSPGAGTTVRMILPKGGAAQ